MSEPVLDAPTYEHGFVVGRYLTAVADGPDLDRLMDFTPAKGKVVFTPETVIRRHEGPAPALVVQRPVTCELDEQGYLTSPGGGRGVALIAGIYTVRFDVQGAQVPGPTRIEVKDTHTEAAPLDLVLAMPEVVPPGSVVVVDETTAQRAEAAAARAEAVVADIESEVRAVVLASPELKGKQGDQGDPGEPGAPGDPGEPGPAPSLKIGTVTSGSTPSATIKGTSPDLTLDLVFAKGDQGGQGIQGPPGMVSSASAYVIVGPGRPDTPSTTGGVITGSEPVGAEYRSTDGANVGAWVWHKRPGNVWEAVELDTLTRYIAGDTAILPQGGEATIRRIGRRVRLTLAGIPRVYNSTIFNIPTGFRGQAGINDAGKLGMSGHGSLVSITAYYGPQAGPPMRWGGSNVGYHGTAVPDAAATVYMEWLAQDAPPMGLPGRQDLYSA